MRKHKKSLNRSITIGCIIFLVLLSTFMSIGNYMMHKGYVYQDYQNRITSILDYTKSHIDANDLKECIETKVESEKYKETLAFMDGIIDHYEEIHYLYAILPLNEEETGNVMSVLSAERYEDRYINTEGNLYLGWVSNDEYDSNTAKKMFEILNGDSIVFFEEKTEWGTDYTGAIPIKDSSGNSVCVLAVDIDASSISSSVLRYTLFNLGLVALFGVIFIGLFLLWSNKNITKPIKALEESACNFVGHSHHQRNIDELKFEAPELNQDNEIKSLSDAVVKMTEDIKEYVLDITSAEELVASMEDLANHDALTGVKNTNAYYSAVERLDGDRVGIAIVDLNGLKRLNDTYGHDKGDVAIKKVSSLVCNIFAHSPVYRIGGDEFAIILQNHDFDHYKELEKRFFDELDKIQNDPNLKDWERVSAAIGVAFLEKNEDIDSLFERADQMMYSRKKEMKEHNNL